MPRSYSYDHFQVPQSLPKQKASLTQEDKQQLSGAVSVGDTGIHYGKAHAETEQILQARQMAKQLEELAAPTLEAEEKFSRSATSTRPKGKKQAKAAAAAPRAPPRPSAHCPRRRRPRWPRAPRACGACWMRDSASSSCCRGRWRTRARRRAGSPRFRSRP
jgi:hypothetical protein